MFIRDIVMGPFEIVLFNFSQTCIKQIAGQPFDYFFRISFEMVFGEPSGLKMGNEVSKIKLVV